MGGCKKGPCCKVTSGIVGLICVVTGCVLIEVFNTLIHDKVEDSLPLKEGSESYKNWVSPPAPIYFSVYLQHVANAEEVVQYGAKPTLVERGPYTYRERREKVNITFEDGNTTVSYKENQWYYFDRNRSAGPESDVVTTVNLPMLTIANMVRFEFGLFQLAVNELLELTGEHLFINLTVADLMWGYEDSLLKEVKSIAQKFHVNLTLDDKFGLFINKNGSNDGVYKVKTGSGGTIDEFAQIVTWNGNSSLDFWNSAQANGLNGSDGTMYPPFVNKDTVLYLFSSDICRSLEIRYTKDYTLKGIEVDRFVVPPMTLANVSVNPANEGFCTPFCLPAGLLNASACRDGAPVILSLPHFLDGDPRVRDRINGMMPKREDHQSVIDIEPMTGVVMNAAKRIQLNAYLNKIPHIRDTDQLKDYVILPILWLQESATIDDKSASDFKSEVLMAVRVTEAVKYGLIALGGVILLGLLMVLVITNFCRRSRDREMATFGDQAPILT